LKRLGIYFVLKNKAKKQKFKTFLSPVENMRKDKQKDKLNILLIGVGGQGILTSATILAKAAMYEGKNVITAETHGMAQRGGSVEVHVRIGNVYAPLIPEGRADYVISLEMSEILRYTNYINDETIAIVSEDKIAPPSVSRGEAKYPEKNVIESITDKIYFLNAREIANKAGNVLASNVVVLGAFCRLCDYLSLESMEKAIFGVFPQKLVDVNLKALRMGYESIV